MHVWQLLIIGGLLASCGDDRQPTTAVPQVIIASDQQIADLQVKANSYLVMFKTIAGLKQVRFHSYRAEVQHFAGFINDRYQFDSGITDLRMITAIEMPVFTAKSPFSTLNWRHQQPPEVGVLVEATFASNRLAAAHLKQWQERGDIYFAEPNYLSTTANKVPPPPVCTGKVVPIPLCEQLHEQSNLYEKYSSSEGNEEGIWWHKEVYLAEAMRYISDHVNGVATNVDSNIVAPPLPSDPDRVPPRPPDPNQVLIAVFDSGIDYEHPALEARMYKNEKGEDFGCDKALYGCNTTAATKQSLGDGETRPWGTNKAERDAQGGGEVGGKCPTPTTEGYHSCPHGTHVAGIIVADGEKTGDEATKMAGVCPFCKIVNVRVLSDVSTKKGEPPRGGITDSALLNGLKYIDNMYWKGNNVRIINASIGKFHRSRSVALLISLLKERDGGGVLVIGAAGNEDTMARTYPAALDSVLAVSATDGDGRKSTFSNLGMWVDIAAPGGGGSGQLKIKSTVPGSSYESQAGTSMATPVVAGIAGLFLSVWAKRDLDASLLEDYLIASSSSEKLYEKNTRYKVSLETIDEPVPLLGKGLVDAKRLIEGIRDNELARIDLEGDEYRRVDWTSCGTVAGSSWVSLYLLFISIGGLVLALRGFQ